MTTPQNRVRPGIPSGGQFAPTAHAEPGISLGSTRGDGDNTINREPEAAAPVQLPETQRRIRGHRFYAPKAVLAKVPALGATEDVPLMDKKVHLHYFTGGADWYLMEVDPASGRAFGFLNPSGRGGSWGYVSLPELEAVNLGGYRVVERDCHFSQGTLADVTRNR
ncbi:DUF2958 domain-containing protein (plasmid) [Pseudarthrobacter sp. P1]|uniref:DUF2958 domain-containing protein n=1 Tax=Pseudarthrobacter sp. P1 TaxID=3418418 RepID=UPI003CF5935F